MVHGLDYDQYAKQNDERGLRLNKPNRRSLMRCSYRSNVCLFYTALNFGNFAELVKIPWKGFP